MTDERRARGVRGRYRQVTPGAIGRDGLDVAEEVGEGLLEWLSPPQLTTPLPLSKLIG